VGACQIWGKFAMYSSKRVLILNYTVGVFLFLAFTGTSQSVYWNMVWKLYRQNGPAGNCGT